METQLLEVLEKLCGQSPKSQRFLLAISGGLDSVSLAWLLSDLSLDVALGHCNFQLRGEESAADARFVRALAAELGVPYFETVFDTVGIAASQGGSIQMVARDLRYEWLEATRAAQGFDWILTAHHAQDAVETFFINLSRGAGIKGLLGIPARRGKILRPLLQITREQLAGYQKKRGFAFREDSSNAKTDYLRNRIRHLLLPELEMVQPGFEDNIRHSIAALQDTQRLLDAFILSFREEAATVLEGVELISLEKVQRFVEPDALLYALLKPYGFNAAQIRQIGEGSAGRTGASFYSPTHRCLIDRDRLLLFPLKELAEGVPMVVAGVGSFTGFGCTLHITFPATPDTRLMGKDRIWAAPTDLLFPLTWRRWRAGDRMAPFGMEGRYKKVQDILTDRQMNRQEKEEVTVLEDAEGKLIWIPGVRASEWLRIDLEKKEPCYFLEIE